MSFYAQNNKEKGIKTIFRALKRRKRAFNRARTLHSLLLLLVVVSLLGESAIPAVGATQKPQKTIGTTETLNVYPSRVVSSEWFGVEHVLSSDLSADAMYQSFTENNAAFVTDEVPTEEELALPPPPAPVTADEV